ncbi:unnamed protein product [Prorocentrum cordatum]|uniref:Uncharacterized protein n=1 Tax=Prorocentrum cordatum TaxID=2364126 RepID=A0ABN9TD90_9DINO|nr:unnamed protein product [Polarella glacialis]
MITSRQEFFAGVSCPPVLAALQSVAIRGLELAALRQAVISTGVTGLAVGRAWTEEKVSFGILGAVPGAVVTAAAHRQRRGSSEVESVEARARQQVHRFRQLPTAAELEQLQRDGALMVGGVAPAAAGAAGGAGPGEAGVVARAGAHAAAPVVAHSVWLATGDFRGLRRGERLPDSLVIEGDSALLSVAGGFATARLEPAGEIDAFAINDLRAPPVKFSQHEAVCRVIEPRVGVDQLDAPALQSAELLCRRLQVIEGARAVSPSAPDYSAADEYAGWAPHRGGAAAAPQLQKHAAANLRDKAAVLKEAKKVKEEQKLRRGPKGGGGKGGPAPSPAAKHVRSRAEIPDVDAAAPAAETVPDPTGKECALDYESRKMKTPDERSRALDSEPPITTYMDEVLKNDHAAYHPFISDLARANTSGFTCRPKDLAMPFSASKKSGAQGSVWDAREPQLDAFKDTSTTKAPRISDGGHLWGPWELNRGFNEAPLEALRGGAWKQVASARAHAMEPVAIADGGGRAVSRLGLAARKRPAAGRCLARKDFLECRPFIGASRAERSARRQETSGPCHLLGPDERGFLEWNAVAPQTQRNYQEALAEFQSSAGARSLPLATAADADLALTNCADFAWGTGLERAVLLKTYAALISERPNIPRKGSLRLPRFSRAPQGWKRLDPGQTRPPIPWQVTALLVAIMIVVMFWAYFRPSEHYGSNLHPSVREGLADESILLDSVEAPWLGPLAARCRTAAPTMLPFGSNARDSRARGGTPAYSNTYEPNALERVELTNTHVSD